MFRIVFIGVALFAGDIRRAQLDDKHFEAVVQIDGFVIRREGQGELQPIAGAVAQVDRRNVRLFPVGIPLTAGQRVAALHPLKGGDGVLRNGVAIGILAGIHNAQILHFQIHAGVGTVREFKLLGRLTVCILLLVGEVVVVADFDAGQPPGGIAHR